MFKVLFILIFALTECYGHGLCQAPLRHLGGCWEDAQNEGLGYLWFEKSTRRFHRSAVDFCKDKDSFLVEIFDLDQKLFLEDRIINIDASHTTWWTGGKRATNKWIWMNSSQPVGNFVWFIDPQDNPAYEIYLCLIYSLDDEGNDNYLGETCQDEKHHTICQRM